MARAPPKAMKKPPRSDKTKILETGKLALAAPISVACIRFAKHTGMVSVALGSASVQQHRDGAAQSAVGQTAYFCQQTGRRQKRWDGCSLD